jgi:hypothetical protein
MLLFGSEEYRYPFQRPLFPSDINLAFKKPKQKIEKKTNNTYK